MSGSLERVSGSLESDTSALRSPQGLVEERGDYRSASHGGRRIDERFSDTVFLVGVSIASSFAWTRGLGFYSDDWGFLGVLRTAGNQSFLGLVLEQFDQDALLHIRMRPTQIVLQAVLYRLFGLHPLGYHIFSVVVFAAIAFLAYRVLLELGASRLFAVSIPVVFVTMANFSTDRFWFAAFGYPVALCLYLIALFADCKVVAAQGGRRIAWTSLAVLCLVGAGLANETILPLFLVNALVLYRGFRGNSRRDDGRLPLRAWTIIGVHVAAIAAIIAYKGLTAEFLGDLPGGFFLHVRRLIAGSLLVNFGSFGIGLPYTAAWSLRHAGPLALSIALVVSIVVFLYLRGIGDVEFGTLARLRRQSRTGAILGVVVFALGYAVFLTTGRIILTSTGIGNRVGLVPSTGLAVLIVGVIGMASVLLRSVARRRTLFSGCIAVFVFIGSVTLASLSNDWRQAWGNEQRVMTQIEGAFPTIPMGTTLIVDRVCPYVGSAIVFESSWDLAGALRVHYVDRTLGADVPGHMRVEPNAITASVYGNWSSVYPYGPRLLVFNSATGQIIHLLDSETAFRYFRTDSPRPPEDCQAGTPGRGVDFLPFDILYRRLEEHGFK